ncbi:MAG: DUF2062 domain-containing protein [Bdellovibrio bacteriovorus]
MKHWLRRNLPSSKSIRENRNLSVFGKLLHDPNLWHLNRRSAAGAFGVGLFMMYMPPIGQMFMAAAAAIVLRVNLPISVALVWITNPLTIPPMFYFAYLVGCAILGAPAVEFSLEFWSAWRNWVAVLAPLALGMLICATVCSAAGYFGVQALWRWSLMRDIRHRKARIQAMAGSTTAAPGEAKPRIPSSRRQT